MGFKRYASGAWSDIESMKRYASGAWQDCESAKKYSNGAWSAVWTGEPRLDFKDEFMLLSLYKIKIDSLAIAITLDAKKGGSYTFNFITDKPFDYGSSISLSVAARFESNKGVAPGFLPDINAYLGVKEASSWAAPVAAIYPVTTSDQTVTNSYTITEDKIEYLTAGVMVNNVPVDQQVIITLSNLKYNEKSIPLANGKQYGSYSASGDVSS